MRFTLDKIIGIGDKVHAYARSIHLGIIDKRNVDLDSDLGIGGWNDCGEAEKSDQSDCASVGFHDSTIQNNLSILICARIQRVPRDC